MTNWHNTKTADWGPLERAVDLAGQPAKLCDRFMWMMEHPEGTHHYKHCDTRHYAVLRDNSSPEECQREITKALGGANANT